MKKDKKRFFGIVQGVLDEDATKIFESEKKRLESITMVRVSQGAILNSILKRYDYLFQKKMSEGVDPFSSLG